MKRNPKVVFLYEGPHAVHAEWARAVNAEFIPDLNAGPKMGSGWPKRIFNAFRRLFILNRIPKNTDVLLLEGGLGFVVGFLFKKFRKGKVIMIVSDPLFYVLRRIPLLAKISYYMMKDFDGFIPTSKLMASLIPFKNKRIVYPFANVKKFGKIKADINSKNIIYVGVLNKQKGVDKTVKVFLQIRRTTPEAKLFLVGLGPLKREIENIKNKNIILTGFVKNPQTYMKECCIYINLSRLDPFGVGVVEAMAAGLVPIISKNVGAKDLVKKVDRNLIVKEEDEAAKIILSLLKDRKKISRLSEKAKKEAVKYNKENSVKEFKKSFYNFIK